MKDDERRPMQTAFHIDISLQRAMGQITYFSVKAEQFKNLAEKNNLKIYGYVHQSKVQQINKSPNPAHQIIKVKQYK